MVMWRDRHIVYKIGFCGLVLSILAYIVAFALPYWSVLRLRNYGYLDQTIGLWQACLHETLRCGSNVFRSNPVWLNASRVLCSLALLLYLLSLGIGYYRNATQRGQADLNHGRNVERTAIVATVVGAIGCTIFACEFHRIYISKSDVGQLYWAFGAVTSALCVAGFSSCVMFAYNRRMRRGYRYNSSSNNNNNRRRRTATATTTVSGRVPNGPSYSVRIQFPASGLDHEAYEGEDVDVHIPYFGDVRPDQLVRGATPLQPPAYETIMTTTTTSTSAQHHHHHPRQQLPCYPIGGTCVAGNGAGRLLPHDHPHPHPVIDGGGGVIIGMTMLSPNVFGGEAPPPYEEIAKDCVLPSTATSDSTAEEGEEGADGTGHLVRVPETPVGCFTSAAASTASTAGSGTTTTTSTTTAATITAAATTATTMTTMAGTAANNAAGKGACDGDAEETGSGNRS